jgi:hypothetical protein
MSRIKVSPSTEGVNVDADLDLFYDRRKFEDANANDILSFFTPNPQGTSTQHNYNQNPFEGTEPYRILAARLRPTFMYLLTDGSNNIDAPAVHAQLKDAVVTIRDKGGQNRVSQRRLGAHLNSENLAVKKFHNENGANAIIDREVLVYKGYAIDSLPEWFTLSATQQFEMTVQFQDSTAFPTQSEVESSGQIQHTFGLEAVFQYASLN